MAQIGEAGGVKYSSQASAATNFAPNALRLMWYDQGCMIKLAFGLLATGGLLLWAGMFFLESGKGFAVALSCLLLLLGLALAALLVFCCRMVCLSYKNGLLTAAVVESTKPPTLVHIANMSTGRGGSFYGILRTKYDAFPSLGLQVGRHHACVSTFARSANRTDCWQDFRPVPVVFGTKDAIKIARCVDVVEQDEDGNGSYYEILERFLAKNALPEDFLQLAVCDGDGNLLETRQLYIRSPER